jgi:hypothetical protein
VLFAHLQPISGVCQRFAPQLPSVAIRGFRRSVTPLVLLQNRVADKLRAFYRFNAGLGGGGEKVLRVTGKQMRLPETNFQEVT